MELLYLNIRTMDMASVFFTGNIRTWEKNFIFLGRGRHHIIGQINREKIVSDKKNYRVHPGVSGIDLYPELLTEFPNISFWNSVFPI